MQIQSEDVTLLKLTAIHHTGPAQLLAHLIIFIIIITRPRPAFERLGLGGSSRGYSSHGQASHAALRACGGHLLVFGGSEPLPGWFEALMQ